MPVDLSIFKVDMHSHLIPNIDDGSKSIDETINMLLKFESMDHQVTFLHFETCARKSSKKTHFCRKSGCELDFLPHIYRYSKLVQK